MSSLARLSRALPRCRLLHVSAPRRDLVGPPDPVSNLRPVIYDDPPTPASSASSHPYSLREFTGDTREYQWKVQRQELDSFNHKFWTDVSVTGLVVLRMTR
jgi:apoptogenic protein 1